MSPTHYLCNTTEKTHLISMKSGYKLQGAVEIKRIISNELTNPKVK